MVFRLYDYRVEAAYDDECGEAYSYAAEINYIVDFKSHIRYFCVSVKHITILLYVGQANYDIIVCRSSALRYFYRSVKRAAEELAAHLPGNLLVRDMAVAHVADVQPVDEREVQCIEARVKTFLESGSVFDSESDLNF